MRYFDEDYLVNLEDEFDTLEREHYELRVKLKEYREIVCLHVREYGMDYCHTAPEMLEEFDKLFPKVKSES